MKRAVVMTVAGEGADLSKPSAYESEIHPSHKLRLYSGYFALPGAIPPIGEKVRKRVPMHPLTVAVEPRYSERKRCCL